MKATARLRSCSKIRHVLKCSEMYLNNTNRNHSRQKPLLRREVLESIKIRALFRAKMVLDSGKDDSLSYSLDDKL